MGLFSSKKKKKAKRRARNIQEFINYYRSLAQKTPAVKREELISRLLGIALPKKEAETKEQITTAITPTWTEAGQRALSLAQTVPGTLPTDISKFFEKRKGEVVERETKKIMEQLTPEYVRSLSEFAQAFTSPEAAIVGGLAQKYSYFWGKDYGGAGGDIRRALSEAKQQYASLLETTAKYLQELGITEISAEDLYKTVWGF